jgi:hypothetical protein
VDAEDAAVLKPIRDRGVLIIVFGSASICPKTAKVADCFLRNYLRRRTPMQHQVASSMDLTHLWALTGDVPAGTHTVVLGE